MELLQLMLASAILATAASVNYVIVAPGVMRPGLPYEFSVSLTNAAPGPANILAAFLDSDDTSVISAEAKQMTPGTTEVITLMVRDSMLESTYRLQVNATGALKFTNTTRITNEQKSHSVFVQTDKPMYKPGDKVQFRAFAVAPDLMPYTKTMKVEISDPRHNKLKSYNVNSDQLKIGVYSGSFQLSDQPVVGEWTLQVTSAGQIENHKFPVEHYVLPKFEVSIDMPDKFSPKYEGDLLAVVEAKYTYGKPIRGVVHIEYGMKHYSGKREFVDGELTDGKYELEITSEMIYRLCSVNSYTCQWDKETSQLNIRNVITFVVNATVTEEHTGQVMNDEVMVDLSSSPLQLLLQAPETFKSHMLYSGIVKLVNLNGGPPTPLLDATGQLMDKYKGAHVNLVVTLRYGQKDMASGGSGVQSRPPLIETLPLPLTNDGLMPFEIKIADKFEKLQLVAKFNYTADLQLSQHNSEIPEFKTRDDQSLQVALVDVDGSIKEGTLKVKVESTVDITGLNYLVLSKGRVVSSMRTNFAPTKSHTLEYTVVPSKLAPKAKMIVYVLSSDGEIIVDAIEFNVDGLFTNKVAVEFNQDTAKPKDAVELKVTADADSYVAVLGVDRSVMLLGTGNDIDVQRVEAEMAKYDSGSSGFPPMCRGCGGPMGPMFRRKRSIWFPYFSQGNDASDLFEKAGVKVMTDALVYEAPQDWGRWPMFEERGPGIPGQPGPPMPMPAPAAPDRPANGPEMDSGKDNSGSTLAKPTRTRTRFPQTWLWTDSSSGSDGTVIFDAVVPDTMTSWNVGAFAMNSITGLGVSEEVAKLEVQQDFFISLNLPYSVIRGESFVLSILVFNYKSEDMDASVTLVVNKQFVVEDQSEGNVTETLKVPANDAAVMEAVIRPTVLGHIDLMVIGRTTTTADAVKRKLLVEPEGIPMSYSSAEIMNMDNDVQTVNFDVEFPDNLVTGSEYVTTSVVGDMMGPSVSGLDSLLKMPYGCGEQNMLNFAPNIYVMDYLTATDQVTAQITAKATHNMESGYQRELDYQRRDHSFSAFGDNDNAGSTWLTAFVLKTINEAQEYIYVDITVIVNSMIWIGNQQNDKGFFVEPTGGRVIHANMQGGTGDGVAMTAYVLTALLENKDIIETMDSGERQALEDATANALRRLESEIETTSDVFVVVITTYALHLADSSKAQMAFDKMLSLATEKDGVMYWQSAAEEPPATDDEAENDVRRRMPHKPTSTSSSVEMTAYALLTYAYRVRNGAMSGITDGLPVMRWMAAQRNAYGGYHSTQDTVIALQALAGFVALVPNTEQDVQISLTAGDMMHTFQPIKPANSVVLQTVKIPASVDKVTIEATGKGIALVQLNVKYHVSKSYIDPGIQLRTTSELNRRTKEVTAHVCASWTKETEKSGMFLMQVGQLSSYEANLDQMKPYLDNKSLKRVEIKGRNLVMYLDELTAKETCFDIKSSPTSEVMDIQDAIVTGYAYYSPHVSSSSFYKPEGINDGKGTKEPAKVKSEIPHRPWAWPIRDSGAKSVMTMTSLIIVMATITTLLLK